MTPATSSRRLLPLWAGSLAATLLLLAWTRALALPYLVGAGLVFLAVLYWLYRHVALLRPAPRRWVQGGLAVLAIGLLVGAVAHWRFELIEFRWDRLNQAREEKLARTLRNRMNELQARAEQAAVRGARAAAVAQSRAARAALRGTPGEAGDYLGVWRALAEIREQTEVDALAMFDRGGGLIAWSGEHRGRLPNAVLDGQRHVHFEERPLFSYLYFLESIPGTDLRVLAAVLVETGLGTGETFGELFVSPLDPRVTFHTGHPGVVGTAVWALADAGDTIVQARLRPVEQAERRKQVERTPRQLGILLALVAFAAFSVAWVIARGTRRAASYVPVLALLPLLALAPLDRVLGLGDIFSPAFFVLRMPGDLTLGRVLALLLPIAAVVAALHKPSISNRRLWLATVLGSGVVALGYPGGLRFLIDAATRPLLESGTPLWIALQLACVLLLSILTVLALPRVQPRADQRESRAAYRLLAFGGALVAGVLGTLLGAAASVQAPQTTRFAMLWVAPFVLVALGTAYEGGRTGSVRRWLFAGWLAITATLPHLWSAHVQARLASAEVQLATLGTKPDPYLEFLLRQFQKEASDRYFTGERGVQLLYRSWVASGLAAESYPARVSLWSPNGVELAQLGGATVEELTQDEGYRLRELQDDARVEGSPGVYTFTDQPHMFQVLALPLPDGDVITVLVPPRRSLGAPTGLALFFGAQQSGGLELNLVPSVEAEPPIRDINWQRTPAGWRSESEVQYPDGHYHAHLLVPVPQRAVWLARAALIITLDAAVLLLLWSLGVLARGATPLSPGAWASWRGSFRARVTVALLAFFLIPTVVFGYVAYRAVSREVERATQIVAQRAAVQAEREFSSVLGDLRVLAQHAGTDVLRYLDGVLLDVSSPEALDLGVYNAWIPPQSWFPLAEGEERSQVDVQSFGGQRYVTAYQALTPTGTLAIPMPLVSGDVAVRQRELAHMIAFAAVLGALLSIALSVAVGRALAGPIGLLRRASAAVGAGRLRVRLPEEEGGEFGQVFTSFNRMVRRLRRARARELRSARVLAWGEMARQVAHEIKNPLTPIKLSVQHIRRARQDRHPQFDRILETSVHEILREIDRLSEIARAFSRYGAPTFAAGPLEPVNVESMITEALTLYRAGDEGVRYESIVDPGVPLVMARAGELKEVLLNLLENARTALDGSGTVVVRALAHDERIELEVEDDGPGITPDLLPRVFDPHFSTRSTGTGLGLAIVRRLVESWGGTVDVDSRPGQGTTVRVRMMPVPSSRDS